jgi:uncharacterized protein YndB with AHSA1/START domain
MAIIETTTVIKRPPGDVFAFLSDPRNTPKWTPSLKEVRAEGPMRVGARGRDVLVFLGRRLVLDWEITEYTPGRRYAFRYEGPLSGDIVYLFEPVGEGTRVTCRADVRGRGWLRLLTPLMAMEGKKEDAANFARLKALLEAAGPAAGREASGDAYLPNGTTVARTSV